MDDPYNGHTDVTDLVYGLTDHSHIPIVHCYAISDLFDYTVPWYKSRS